MSQLHYRGSQRQESVPQGVNHSSGYFCQTEQETTPFIINTKEDAVTATLPVRVVARDGDDQACGDDVHDPHDATVSSRFAFGSILGGFGALYSNILHIKREANKAAAERKSAELKRRLAKLVLNEQRLDLHKEYKERYKAIMEGCKESHQTRMAWLEAAEQDLETEKRSLVATKGSLGVIERQVPIFDESMLQCYTHMEKLDEEIAVAKKMIESLTIQINALEKAINGIKSDLSLLLVILIIKMNRKRENFNDGGTSTTIHGADINLLVLHFDGRYAVVL